jgi:hypothetical protein
LTPQTQCTTQTERNCQVLNYANITWEGEIKRKIKGPIQTIAEGPKELRDQNK